VHIQRNSPGGSPRRASRVIRTVIGRHLVSGMSRLSRVFHRKLISR